MCSDVLCNGSVSHSLVDVHQVCNGVNGLLFYHFTQLTTEVNIHEIE